MGFSIFGLFRANSGLVVCLATPSLEARARGR